MMDTDDSLLLWLYRHSWEVWVLKVSYKIVKGINKEKCDDTALIGTTIINNKSGFIELEHIPCICISDGVGGNTGGDEASFFLMQHVLGLDTECCKEQLREKLLDINRLLLEHAKKMPGHENMATTFTGVFFDKNQVKLAHCGNTRLYMLQGRFLKQITPDQTTYQWLISNGNRDIAERCNKNEIRGAFGGGSLKYVDSLIVEKIFERRMPPLMLLTSDGIHDFLNIDEIEDIVSSCDLSLEEKTDKLINTAISKGSYDDCSAILIENNK